MTKIHIAIITLLFSTLSISCSKSSSKAGDGTNTPQGDSCSLVGTWTRCSNYGGSSGRVSIVATENQIHEVIENFNTVEDCQGTPDQTMDFDAGYVLGSIGQSTFVTGGTDADITPNVDLFGCGANMPAYTVIKFSEDCGEFQPAQTAPSCDASQRGTSLDPQPFLKQ